MLRKVLSGGLLALASLPQLSPAAGPGYNLTPVAGKFSSAVDMNNAGQIAVNNLASDVPYRSGYIYGGTTPEEVGTLGGTQSTIRALNNRGEAVGSSTTADGDAGAIVGYGSTAAGQDHAFVFDDGVMRDLIPSATNSRAFDVNNHGQIVGTMDERAFIYQDGTLADLDTLIVPGSGFSLVSALAINDRGQILATACDATRTFCDTAVRLNPIPLIPEPGSIGMLLAGAALLGLHSLGRRPGRPIWSGIPAAAD